MYHVFDTSTRKKQTNISGPFNNPLTSGLSVLFCVNLAKMLSEESPHIQQWHFQSLGEVGFLLNHLRHIIPRALHQG